MSNRLTGMFFDISYNYYVFSYLIRNTWIFSRLILWGKSYRWDGTAMSHKSIFYLISYNDMQYKIQRYDLRYIHYCSPFLQFLYFVNFKCRNTKWIIIHTNLSAIYFVCFSYQWHVIYVKIMLYEVMFFQRILRQHFKKGNQVFQILLKSIIATPKKHNR